MSEPTWHKACRLQDVTDTEPVGVKLDGTPIGIFRVDGRCYAVHDICTHEYALLSQGWQDGTWIECPLHQARFDVVTGKCLAGPAHDDVAVFPVRIDGDDVWVGIPPKP
ncbi:MAG: non-heme iron oxygenase ferredoxin subunit [Proteobacteria bacterium]|nr:non-heme iron oxygenase ferredoxin subunit [Pseudomonadota bacterium]